MDWRVLRQKIEKVFPVFLKSWNVSKSSGLAGYWGWLSINSELCLHLAAEEFYMKYSWIKHALSEETWIASLRPRMCQYDCEWHCRSMRMRGSVCEWAGERGAFTVDNDKNKTSNKKLKTVNRLWVTSSRHALNTSILNGDNNRDRNTFIHPGWRLNSIFMQH